MTDQIPDALKAYYDRVGAEVLNFRRAMIRIYKGHYYHEKALIKIDAEGNVICSNEEYAPTDAELAAIKVGVSQTTFPKCIEAEQGEFDYWARDKVKERLYKFVSRKTGKIIMVQERRMFDDGRKAYIPYVLFSDGIWRSMEPDGKLPFWKPDQKRSNKIMIHEGAKVAAAVEKMEIGHPWYEELKEYEHWGAIGGALAPHRCMFDEIWAERPTEVVYVCDNDRMGKDVLQVFSKHYGHALKGVMFDLRWPESWDLADPMPKGMFSDSGRYNGPSFKSLVRPATWATEMVKSEKGPKHAVIKKEFLDEWYHCVVPEVFVHIDHSNQIFSPEEFNNLVRPYSDVENVARLVKTSAASKGAWLKYSPPDKPGIFLNHNVTCLNTHMPTVIKSENGDASPFLEFITHLIPNERDRKVLLRWCATLIARLDIKMLYGVLLISETQGIGKSTLGEKILAPLVGEGNVSFPSESEVVDSTFNYWAAHKRLAVVHEIYAGHSSKAYDRLKNLVTDKNLMINKKFQAAYQIENWIHVFACSNSKRAIHLSGEDRRWFVPEVTERKQPIEFWVRLNNWLEYEGGLGIIRHWAENHGDYVIAGEPAPWSLAKMDVIEEGYSPGMQLVAKFLSIIKEREPERKIVILDSELVRLIQNYLYDGRHNDRLEKPSTLCKVAKQMGWYVSKKRTNIRQLNMYNVRVITNDRDLLSTEIEQKIEKFLNVMEKARDWDFGKN